MMEYQQYWDAISDEYQRTTSISCDDFHYGPLLPGDRELKLLPEDVAALTCLEVACGAGQNSCYLASRGAVCTAIDSSAVQLGHGRHLAIERGVDINFFQEDMDNPELVRTGKFDLIHSAFGLPFAADPAALINRLRTMLNPGGQLLISVGHPLYAGDWIELESGQEGVFLSDYFHLPADARVAGKGSHVKAHYFPVSAWTEWLHNAGMQLERLLEPCTVDPDVTSDEDLKVLAPYSSEAWIGLYPLLKRVPSVLIISAILPPRKR